MGDVEFLGSFKLQSNCLMHWKRWGEFFLCRLILRETWMGLSVFQMAYLDDIVVHSSG